MMKVKDYLKRISAPLKEPSLAYLRQLQYLHMTKVPFENLDVLRQVPIYLNLERIYKKIVHDHRGGYCYEVNGLFHWLLKELGFEVFLIAATVRRPTGKFARPNTHMAMIVELGEPYLVDVGFGHSQLQPLTLKGETFTDVSGTYKVERISKEYFDLKRLQDEEFQTLYRFTLKQREFIDFHEGVVFNQVSKNSSFTHHDLVTMATSTGRITLKDCTLTTTINDERTETTLEPSKKQKVLQEIFGLYLKD